MDTLRQRIFEKLKNFRQSFTSNDIFYFFVFLNLILYIERGILPGSNREFNQFVQKNLTETNPDTYVGLLQSGFVAGLSLSSPLAGHLMHKMNPRTLIFISLIIWNVAIFSTSLSGWVKSYYLLFFSRILSGVGESSFISFVPPFIMKYGGMKKGRWLAIYFFMLPLGAALGFGYGGAIANSSLGWPFAFVFLNCIAFFFAFFLLLIPSNFFIIKNEETENKNTLIQSSIIEDTKNYETSEINSSLTQINKTENILSSDKETQPITFISEVRVLSSKPIFWCMIVNSAAYSASIISLQTFISAFVLYLGFFDSETVASILLGAIISISGILGTFLGGYIADWIEKAIYKSPILKRQLSSTNDNSLNEKMNANSNIFTFLHISSLSKIAIMIAFSGCFFMILSPFMNSVYLFLLLPSIGLIFIFSTVAFSSLILMLSVPVINRPFAISASVILQHVFGDVPSQIIIGYIKDILSPHCIYHHETNVIDPKCIKERIGIRITLLIISCWFVWLVISFFASWLFARNTIKKNENKLSASFI